MVTVAPDAAELMPHSRLEVEGVGVVVEEADMVAVAVLDMDSDTDAVCEYDGDTEMEELGLSVAVADAVYDAVRLGERVHDCVAVREKVTVLDGDRVCDGVFGPVRDGVGGAVRNVLVGVWVSEMDAVLDLEVDREGVGDLDTEGCSVEPPASPRPPVDHHAIR